MAFLPGFQGILPPDPYERHFDFLEALNTVLAFVSSKKQIATTFDATRSSVERLLKRQVQMYCSSSALLPDLVKFSYIPKNDLKVNETDDSPNKRRAKSPDFLIPSSNKPSTEENGHVLVLEFFDNVKGKKSRNVGLSYQQPVSLSPAAVKKLIETRNDVFRQAVNDLIAAVEGDPVQTLREAAQEHIPVDPCAMSTTPKVGKPISVILDANSRPSMDDLIQDLMNQDWYREQIVFRKTVDPRDPQTGEIDSLLSPSVSQALVNARHIKSLYAHQVAAIQALFRGKHVVVSTSTASGKSLIYQVPILKSLEEDPNATTICIYPTKALAQDQKTSLEKMIRNCPGLEDVQVSTYDGDTPQEMRPVIRETASVIFTNFDTIHASILPHEEAWRSFLRNVKLVVVDELHYYSGLLGSHVAFIMRRFRRVCAAIGNHHMRFVSCTATLANPQDHMQKIFGLAEGEIEVVDVDGAPSGKKDYLVWDPPFIDDLKPNLGRRGSLSEATALMRFLMKRGVRVLLFCKIRKICELAMKAMRTDLSNEGRLDVLAKVRPYRGGEYHDDRRRIEHEAFSGELLGIIATNALELGIDIGALDVVIMLGFPMSVASFLQQAGRAGRRARDSLAILVADPFPVDQYYVNHPEELFNHVMEDIIIDVESPVVLEAHLQCAGDEMPICMEDEQYFGPLMHEVCDAKLIKDKDGWYHTHPNFLPYPPRFVSIRGVQQESYVLAVMRNGAPDTILEEVEVSRAMFEVYEGGVFMHQGVAYIVKEVSHDSKMAKVIQADVNYHTSPRDFTNVDAVRTTRIRVIDRHRAFYGVVNIQVKVFGFFKIRNGTILDSVEIDTPPYVSDTMGLWIDVPRPILELLRSKAFHLAGAIHAAQHAFLNQFPLSEDLKTECKAAEKEYRVTESSRKRPARLIFYDSIGKGGGVAAKAFDYAHETLRKAHLAIENCRCQDGCTKCVQSNSCREANQVSSKMGGGIIIKGILGLPIDPETVPHQGEQQFEIPDTIVEAQTVYARGNVEVEAGDRLH
ncbi:DEAD/H helicase [Macrolepiota fuliginosa MF-IS2]|uniref:DEAD/H helicase n=1 Tax=Macrolepiota fuliginosa MF-IS2 TaxID=1400762 RepID=A0A9P5XNB3_9AGAR|nr:DEAD/H helicase [Macrolepiota fuliginosa MF-IS2]